MDAVDTAVPGTAAAAAVGVEASVGLAREVAEPDAD
jgi:hypothetical protein